MNFDCWHPENTSWTQGLGKRTIIVYIIRHISEGLCRNIQSIVNIKCIYIHGVPTLYIVYNIYIYIYITTYCIREYVKSESQIMYIATNTASDAIQQLISCLISSVAPAYDLIFHRQCMVMLSGSFMTWPQSCKLPSTIACQPFLHRINSAKNDMRTSKGDG